jgi:hypothetical protein
MPRLRRRSGQVPRSHYPAPAQAAPGSVITVGESGHGRYFSVPTPSGSGTAYLAKKLS